MIPLILLLGLASPGDARAALRAHYSTPLSEQATLTLTSDRDSYYVREPIRLRLTLKNAQDKAIRGFFMIGPLSPKAEIRYRSAGSDFVVFPYPGRKGGYAESPVVLRPGEELTGEVTLTFDSARQVFLLPEAGEYEFQVVYSDAPQMPNAVITSNVLTVEVQPAPEGEREALASYSKDLALLAQFDPRWSYVSPEVTRQAAAFLERFPSSSYAHRIRSGLHWALRDRVVRNRATKEERAFYEKLEAERAPSQ